MSIEFKTEADKVSYALGMNIGESLVQLPAELNPDILTQAIKDLLAGNQPALPENDYVAVMKAFQAKMQAAEQDASKEISLQNSAEEKLFMEDNKKAEGVITTASGLQYEVLTAGAGEAVEERIGVVGKVDHSIQAIPHLADLAAQPVFEDGPVSGGIGDRQAFNRTIGCG